MKVWLKLKVMSGLIMAASSGLMSVSVAADPSDYFENLSQQQRRQIMENATVSYTEWFNQNGGVDIVDELNQSCRGLATYTRDVAGNILRPTVHCSYKSDKNLDGMTSKFKCQLLGTNGESVKVKIKYASSLGGSAKEVVPAVLVSGLSRLLGFVSDAYCPAVVVCDGCSVDPWKEMNRSSAPPLVETQNTFEHAVIEVKVPGAKASVPRNGARKPLGFEWHELAYVPSAMPFSQRLSLLAEREALMLWMNFIFHPDADAHNNRLICQSWSPQANSRYQCENSVGYAHDYGDSFLKMNFNRYAGYPVFLESLWSHPTRWGKKCVGSLDKGEGAIQLAVFSEEARQVFLRRFATIAESQVLDLLRLARVGEVTGHSAEEWANVMAHKLDQVRAARCDSLRSGNSVLAEAVAE